MSTLVDQAAAQMDKSIVATEQNFTGIRTGRANPALLNGIMVNYYGSPTPIKQLASVSVPEPRTLAITPFDRSQINAVEKAIRDSDLGVNPNRSSNVIRITLPELTQDRREQYAKMAKDEAEKGKVALRNIRRKAREDVEKQLKADSITEDDRDHLFKQLDDITKKHSDRIDALLESKQSEIMTV